MQAIYTKSDSYPKNLSIMLELLSNLVASKKLNQ